MECVRPIFTRPFRPAMATLATILLSVGSLPTDSAWSQTVPEASWQAEVRIPRATFSPFHLLSLSGPARPGEYLGAVGPQAAWLGFETGEGEVWAHPLKVARDIRLSFSIPQYSEPIPGNQVASEITSSPGHAQVSYSHEAFVVQQHIFAPRDLPGILILLEVDAVVDLEIRVEFKPVLQDAWPGDSGANTSTGTRRTGPLSSLRASKRGTRFLARPGPARPRPIQPIG